MDELKQITELKKIIGEKFNNTSAGIYLIEDMTDKHWGKAGGEIQYCDAVVCNEDDVYGLEIYGTSTHWTYENYYMFLVDDGNGSDEFLVILDIDKYWEGADEL